MFLVFIIAASAFHWSALIMAVVYFLLTIKPSCIYLGIVAAGTTLFCIFSHPVMKLLIDKFYMYRRYDPDTSPEAFIGLPPRYTVIFGILFIICFLLRKKLIEKNPRNSVYINCLMFTVVFEAMGTRHAILSRFALLTYLPPLLFLLPNAVKIAGKYFYSKKGKTAKWFTYAGSAIFSAVCYTILMLSNYNGVVPYVSQFNRPYDIFVETKITEEDDDDEEENEIEIEDLEFSE